jgi:outer membrane lipase/esterase
MILASQANTEQHRFHTVVVFGDSLSDTDNVYKLTNGTWPIVPPYYQGRFSNDLNWVDRLKVSNVKNYAYGGATTDNVVVQGYTKSDTVPVPGVRQQIEIYINSTREQTIDFAHTLYIVSAGGNDFVFSKVPNPFAVVNGLSNAVNDLIAFGAKHILVFNQPPAQVFPYTHALGLDFVFKALTFLFNSILSLRLEIIQKSNSQVSLQVFDLYSIIKRIIDNESGQFTNTVDQCWDTVNGTSVVMHCLDPSKYVFIDKFHFTSSVHKMIADGVNDFISNE